MVEIDIVMIQRFEDFLRKREWYGGSANNPSGVEDEGDGGDALDKKIVKPGAFPSYGDDLPITDKNRKSKISYMKKDCNCKKKR